MLVDTSVWIDYFNGHLSPHANRLELTISNGEPITLTGLVWTEILLGLNTESDTTRISNLLDCIQLHQRTDAN
jgi:predicted nucleic acid-binding protein